ncbi:MAG TPA: zf-HC2 domain-containing protein, partial [Ktedonobacterales bacterium]|nr:zf-HC2 domain-containing protein [Ktedonobacterales bacterium]
MKPLLPGPCAHWATFLDAHPEDLAPADRAALDAHIATCPACAAARADNQDIDARIRSLPDPTPLPGLSPRLLALWEEEDRQKRAPYHLISSRLKGKHMQTQHDALDTGVPTRSSIPPTRHTHRRRLVSGISAIAAVLVIAIIVAALFASRAGKPATTGQGGG